MRNAIASDDGPRPILSVMTMDKHRVIFGGIDYLEHLPNYFVLRQREIRQRDAVVTKSKLAGLNFFRASLCGIVAEIDYRSNPDLFQRL
jgi:hypothetical protein